MLIFSQLSVFRCLLFVKISRLRNIFIHAFIYLVILNKYTIASDDVSNVHSNKKIIIVGAGAAGIAAASKLFDSGFRNVTILEAENRIGGRLYTSKIGNYSVDIGGQWVHGQKDNVAYNLANPLGLLDPQADQVTQEKLFDSSGNAMNNSIDEHLKYFFAKYFQGAGATHVPTTSANSYGEFVRQNYDKEFQNVPEMMELKVEILSYLEVMELSEDSGDTWNDVAFTNNGSYTVREGDQNVAWKTTGYGQILDILMKRYPDPEKELPVLNNTILNTEVTLIDYTNSDNGPIVITTNDGTKFEADHVIVTVSLGVLKAQHQSLFTPPLPSKKIQAIETLGFGAAGKVYFLFEESFLDNKEDYNNTHFGFMWNDADRKIIENDPEKKWELGVTGVWQVEHKPKLFELYISSRWAKIMETVPENKVYNQSFELLQRFLGKKFSIPKPIAMMRTKWYTNPHFRGAYSYHSVQSEDKHTYPETLQESITPENPKVLFAGEATSSHRFSTADGAIESGWTAAESLIKLYKTQ